MRKVLFDHCFPAPLRHKFGRRIQITTAEEAGLEELVNSDLEKAAYDLGYYALLTIDKGFAKPGHIKEFHIPVVLLRSISKEDEPEQERLAVLIPGVERELLAGMDPGVYVRDNYEGMLLSSGSFDESEELRKELKEKEDSSRCRA